MSEARPVRVFLSYARADRARAAKLAEALQAAGITLWWDTAIEGGTSFSADIERELEAADVVVVAWSATSVKSDWVRDEASAGRDRKRLVPVQLDATLPPLGFRQLQSIDLSGWKGRAGDANFVSLISAIHKLAGSAAAVPVTAAPAPSRRLLIGGAVLGAAALAGGGWWLRRPASAANASIAVLPFANLSGDPAQAYFSDGLAEELRSALATVAGLKVAARTSSELMRDTDIKEAAGKLGVAHVLTGSVRRGGGSIRVTAQLLDGETGLESWSAAYDRPAGDVLAVQADIAQSVAAAMSVKFGKAAAMIGGTRSPVAFDAYLRAQAIGRSSEARCREALAFYDQALAADPKFAAAQANRAITLVVIFGYIDTEQPAEARRLLRQAEQGAARAIGLAPGLPIAHTAMAMVRQRQVDLPRADAVFKTALGLQGLVSEDLRLAADHQSQMGRGDLALALMDRAIALDPLNPSLQRTRIILLIDARRADDALAAIDAWSVGSKAGSFSPRTRTRALLLAGRAKDALEEAAKVDRPWLRFYLTALAQFMLGNRAASDAALAALEADSGAKAAYQIASVHAARGEIDRAFAALDVAAAANDPGLLDLRVDHTLDPLRADPRYAALEKRLGFPPR